MATKRMAAPRISQADLWNTARALSPQFASHTAEGTAELFTERGYAEIQSQGMQTLNEFYGIIMPYYLNMVNISHAMDPLDRGGFGEYFEQEYGEYIQRMAVNSIKPITPKYRDLQDGPGPDPFVVRKPEISDRFYRPNFDYQSLVTVPDEWMTKRIFTSEFGFSELLAGIYQGLENGYIIQKYLNKLECINAGINDTKLRPTQSITVTLPDTPTEQNLVDFVLSIKTILSQMAVQPQTSAYNALGFADVQDVDRLRLLVRAGYKNKVDMIAARNSYHRDVLNIPIPVVEVDNFGGLKPYVMSTGETPTKQYLYPVYSSLGEQIGWNTAADQTTVTVNNGDESYEDPNAGVVAVLADKGWLFEVRRNPYIVEPIRNPRGRYTNSWASSPNNTIAYDRLYTFIKFVNGAG